MGVGMLVDTCSIDVDLAADRSAGKSWEVDLLPAGFICMKRRKLGRTHGGNAMGDSLH